jgi:hypothetical protein
MILTCSRGSARIAFDDGLLHASKTADELTVAIDGTLLHVTKISESLGCQILYTMWTVLIAQGRLLAQRNSGRVHQGCWRNGSHLAKGRLIMEH